MRPSALAHAIQFVDGYAQTHEVLQRVLGDGGSTCEAGVAAIQAQSFPNALENQVVCEQVAPGNCGIAGPRGQDFPLNHQHKPDK